ncbi:hypothetical protein ABL78_2105 [Leptomonas seymouri]|uniref:Uncharacterized protein n=1 Tax=Leptomonas seymouri TaxID=5684 RepID=A0A0N1I1B3_LEPSE|nr:hypothetical protein ABL78_2105 [Leptomonas seymouri]|eukprot:KPI88790.1 hypothetical protein ABL78_2105 [Leptomonas seymouri]
MLATVLHVALFVVAIIGLLTIKQRRLRHYPTRRTHIPRRSAEGTIWLQRAVNAVSDMLHCALAEQSKDATGAGASTLDRGNGGPSAAASAGVAADPTPTTKQTSAGERATSARGDDSGSDRSTEVLSALPFLNTLKAQLEEQVTALLEDKGIASYADFRIKDWGGKPPLVKAVCLSHGSGASSSSNTSNATSSMGNFTSSGGLGGGPNTNISVDSTLVGQRSTGGGAGQGMAGGSSALGSPSTLGPQLYASFGGNPTLPSSATGRGAQLGAAAPLVNSSNGGVHSLNLSISPSGDRGANDGVPSIDTPYASTSMRYRNTNNGSAASNGHSGGEVAVTGGGSGVGRERSLAGPMIHPSRMGGGGMNGASAGNLAMGAPDFPGGVGGGTTTASAAASLSTGKNASDTTRSLSVLEAELEVEYSGNFSVSLNADIPIVRGRYLEVYASISDVRMFAAHMRLRLSLEYEPATVESPQPQPYLLGTLWLVSDPVFDVAFHSSLTQYRIRDFFLVPKLVKYFLLRFLRNKLRPTSSPSNAAVARHAGARRRRQGVAAAGGAQSSHSQGASEEAAAEADRASSDTSGISFRLQLPADVVDGGEQWWSSMAHDTMSERPAPFLRTYYQ